MIIILPWSLTHSLKSPRTLCTRTHFLPLATSSSTPATPSFMTSRLWPMLASHTHQGKKRAVGPVYGVVMVWKNAQLFSDG